MQYYLQHEYYVKRQFSKFGAVDVLVVITLSKNSGKSKSNASPDIKRQC